MQLKRLFTTLLSAMVIAGSIPSMHVMAAMPEEATIVLTPMYEYVMTLTAKAGSTAERPTTYTFKCDYDWYTSGGPSMCLRPDGVSGIMYQLGDKEHSMELSDSNDNMVLLTKGKYYYIELANTTENDATIDILFEKDEIRRGGMMPVIAMQEPGSENVTYKVKNDYEDNTTCSKSNITFLGPLMKEYTYTFDLTNVTEDYTLTYFNAQYSSYSGTMQWVGQGSGTTYDYNYRIPATATWSDGRKVSSGTLEHGKSYTYTISYDFPEDKDFWYLLDKQEKDFWSYSDPVVTWKMTKTSVLTGTDEDTTEETKEERDKDSEASEDKSKSSKTKEVVATGSTATVKTGSTEITYKINGNTVSISKVNGTNVKIPAKVNIAGKNYKVTSIDKRAFYKNKSLIEVGVGNSITEIPEECFKGCVNLTSVKLGKKVSIIKQGAFDGCKNLISLTTTRKISKIEKNAFRKTGKKITYIAKNVSKKQAKKTAKEIKKTGKAKKVELIRK